MYEERQSSFMSEWSRPWALCLTFMSLLTSDMVFNTWQWLSVILSWNINLRETPLTWLENNIRRKACSYFVRRKTSWDRRHFHGDKTKETCCSYSSGCMKNEQIFTVQREVTCRVLKVLFKKTSNLNKNPAFTVREASASSEEALKLGWDLRKHFNQVWQLWLIYYILTHFYWVVIFVRQRIFLSDFEQ